MRVLKPSIVAKYRHFGPNCHFVDSEVQNLSDYLEILGSQSPGLWFRGHSRLTYRLVPSALRYGNKLTRARALESFREFRRHAEQTLPTVQSQSVDCEWMQRAQHFGLPTRLLDWTETPAVALYFACRGRDDDGLVCLINPGTLNRSSPLVCNAPIRPEQHPTVVDPYSTLGPSIVANGLVTIAIKPTFNNPRVQAQDGTFTLHGSRRFRLNRKSSPSLVYVPILRRHKRKLLDDLAQMGVTEMKLFPEPDKICAHIRRKESL